MVNKDKDMGIWSNVLEKVEAKKLKKGHTLVFTEANSDKLTSAKIIKKKLSKSGNSVFITFDIDGEQYTKRWKRDKLIVIKKQKKEETKGDKNNKELTDIINKLYGLGIKKVKNIDAKGFEFANEWDEWFYLGGEELKYSADEINKKLKEKWKKAPKKKPSKEHVKFALDFMLSTVNNSTHLKAILTNKEIMKNIKKHGLTSKLTELTLKYPDAVSELAKETKGDKMPQTKLTTKEMGKRKTAYLKTGKTYIDIFIDINGDRIYDQIRIYKAPSTWHKSKKSGVFSAGARAKISVPKKYKGTYVEMKTKKRKKSNK